MKGNEEGSENNQLTNTTSSPACTGTPKMFSSTSPNSQIHTLASKVRIASLFCKANESFTATDPSFASASKRDTRNRRNSAVPFPKAQVGSSTPALTSWKPPTDSWAGQQAEESCADGQYYANGAYGCMGPGRRAEIVGEEVVDG
jgi:hypothetical protein